MHVTIRRQHAAATFAAAAAAAAVLVATASPAQAAAPVNGCPPGYTLLEVAPLTALGYRVPAEADSPSNDYGFGHQPGNGDGYVCGVPMGNRNDGGLQIYNFLDNTLLTW